MYLTANHQTPPQHVRHDNKLWSTAPMIAQGNTAMLGIYPHYSNCDPAPLGTQRATQGLWLGQRRNK